MTYAQVTIPCSESLRFFALLIMCCTILVHNSGTESLKHDDIHETRQDLELPRSIRERRAIKKNRTTNQQDIEKRLKIIEHGYVLPISLAKHGTTEEQNPCRLYFERKKCAKMTEKTCHTQQYFTSLTSEFFS